MPCYHPRPMVRRGFTSSGKPRYVFAPAEQILHIQNSDLESLGDWKDEVISVPCKKCIGCRLEYSRRWADRLMLELDHMKTAVFITLTYNDDNLSTGSEIYLPDVCTGEAIPSKFPTLVKRDIQLFNKRLREYFEGRKIRFYLAGEYGPKTLRPHYHGIYFGLSLSDFVDRKFISFNRHSQPLYTSALLERLWSKGFVNIANVSWQSCAYVARYSLKKLGSEKGFAEQRGVIPEFSLMSRRPGIAGYFPIDHPDVFDNPKDKIFISDQFGVKTVNSVNLPNYLFERLEIVNPLLYDQIKQERKESMNDRFFAEFLKQDLDEVSFLNLKESLHEKGAAVLKRENFV